MTLKFCSLASSSSGNSQYIETENVKILVDAGLSGKQIESTLKSIGVDAKDINYILVTHEHKDHIKGVGILSRRYDIPILANVKTWEGMKDHIGKVKEENIITFDTGKDFELKDLGIKPFNIYHDSNEAVGYNFEGDSITTKEGDAYPSWRIKFSDGTILILK